MSLINREKLCVNREKIGAKNPPFFSPLVFHRLRPHDLSRRLKILTSTFLKVFHRAKFAQKKGFVLTPRLCRGRHAKYEKSAEERAGSAGVMNRPK